MTANALALRLLETDVDDPASALKSIIPGIRTGKVVLSDGVVITCVISRDGAKTGVPTGGKRLCSMGCGRMRFGVRWSDGKLTWICPRACMIENETATLI